jgi:hypothetical protein
VTTFENRGGLHQFLRQTLLNSPNYQLLTAQDGILHFQTTPQNPQSDHAKRPITTRSDQLPITFTTFTQLTSPPQYPITVDFGEVVRLHGYTLHFNRQEEIQFDLDLEPLQPLPADLQPVLYLLDANGEPKGATTDLQPELVWFPPDQWPVRETVRLHFNTFPWHTRETAAYRLALGIVSGTDPWDLSRRHRPSIAPTTELALRLPVEGTLLELARIQQSWDIPQGGPPLRHFATLSPSASPNPTFGQQIRLLNHTPPQITSQNNQLPITNYLSLTLTWQALTIPDPLIRFVQLIGPDGRVYGQNDAHPDNGQYPTVLWQPGEVVVETVAFPLEGERPPGLYTTHLGFYQPETGQRLPLTVGGDHLEIEVR